MKDSRDHSFVKNANKLSIPNPFELILERLDRLEALLLGAPLSAPYTTKCPPPSMSRRRFNEVCRELFARGDERVTKLGRGWTADREAIEVKPQSQAVRVVRAEAWSPEAALAAAGLRPQLVGGAV
jgi:hypothetical protein